MILRAPVDLASTPWLGISEPAKDLITRLLQRNPAQRATAHQVLKVFLVRSNLSSTLRHSQLCLLRKLTCCVLE